MRGLADAAGRGDNITYVEVGEPMLIFSVSQNEISHRGKALAKLKLWLAGEDVETL